MTQEKKQERPSLEEQMKLYFKLMKEDRLPLDTDDIRASYPQKSKQQAPGANSARFIDKK